MEWRRTTAVLLKGGFYLNLLMLLLSVSAAYINPKFFWPPAFIKLFFTGWFAIHCLYFAGWMVVKKKKLAALSAFGLLCCIPALHKMVSFHFIAASHPAEAHSKKELRIMSYNVMGFGWYTRKKPALDILHTLRQYQPDVICMQEYLMRADDHFHIMDTLRNNYGYKYYREHVIAALPRNYYFGLAIYSKVPLGNIQAIPYGNSVTNGAISVDLPMGKDTVRLINLHFESFGLSENEYALPTSEKELSQLSWKMYRLSLSKLRKSFRKKSYQVEQIRNAIDNSPHKVILCGDFNDTPLSYTYAELTAGLDDTFLDTDYGSGSTFAGKIPFLRIDYILADPSLNAKQFYIYKRKASDHYPVICDFGLE